ncbi:MAG: PDZ domain-containing protein [Candidatus Njordarchaeales archaeon]
MRKIFLLLVLVLFLSGCATTTYQLKPTYLQPIKYPSHEPELIITSVLKGSPAELAGLKKGDRIIKLNNEEITTVEQFFKVRDVSKGNISLCVIRDGVEEAFTVQLKENEKTIGVLFRDQLISSEPNRPPGISQWGKNIDMTVTTWAIESYPALLLGIRIYNFSEDNIIEVNPDNITLIDGHRLLHSSLAPQDAVYMIYGDTPTVRDINNQWQRVAQNLQYQMEAQRQAQYQQRQQQLLEGLYSQSMTGYQTYGTITPNYYGGGYTYRGTTRPNVMYLPPEPQPDYSGLGYALGMAIARAEYERKLKEIKALQQKIEFIYRNSLYKSFLPQGVGVWGYKYYDSRDLVYPITLQVKVNDEIFIFLFDKKREKSSVSRK